MTPPRSIDRRTALRRIGSAPLAGMAAETGDTGPPRDLPRALSPTNADSGSLYPDVMRLAGHYGFPALETRFTSMDSYRREGRAAVFTALGPRPAPVDPKPEVVDRHETPEFVREKIVFSTTPQFRVPAYVHIPKGLKGRAPAIIDLHSHGGMFLFGKEKVIDFGRNHPVMTEYHKVNYGGRPTATQLVRRGYIVITIDALPFGERRIVMDEDLALGWERANYSVADVERLNQRCRSKESTLVKSLAFAGMTWPGITTWDDIRTLDYLIARPEVDPERIGCVGISFGGYRSLLLAGLEDRIAAACVVGFMSSVRPMIRRHVDTHSFVHFIPGLHGKLDLPEVVALRAPKPLMVLQCRRDRLFPPEGMEEAVRTIAAVYRKAGASGQFASRFYDVPHIFNVEMQEDAFAWLDKRLKNR